MRVGAGTRGRARAGEKGGGGWPGARHGAPSPRCLKQASGGRQRCAKAAWHAVKQRLTGAGGRHARAMRGPQLPVSLRPPSSTHSRCARWGPACSLFRKAGTLNESLCQTSGSGRQSTGCWGWEGGSGPEGASCRWAGAAMHERATPCARGFASARPRVAAGCATLPHIGDGA